MHNCKWISSPNDEDRISRSGIQEAQLSISKHKPFDLRYHNNYRHVWRLYIADYFITDTTFQYHLNISNQFALSFCVQFSLWWFSDSVICLIAWHSKARVTVTMDTFHVKWPYAAVFRRVKESARRTLARSDIRLRKVVGKTIPLLSSLSHYVC